MVKGVVKRIVILNPTEDTSFEQAIFIVKDNELTGEDLVQEACRIAGSCLQKRRKKWWKSTRKKFLFAGVGIAVVGIFYLILHFFA